MFEEEEKKTEKHWLKEHDSIQMELIKMKKEMIGSSLNGTGEEDIQLDEEVEVKISKEQVGPDENDTTFDDRRKHDTERKTSHFPSGSDQSPSGIKSGSGDKGYVQTPPKLPEGKIPASGDLTNKIANVLQLENKLKRRKYEIEKNQTNAAKRRSSMTEDGSDTKGELPSREISRNEEIEESESQRRMLSESHEYPPRTDPGIMAKDGRNENVRSMDPDPGPAVGDRPKTQPVVKKGRRVIRKILVRKKE